MVDIIERIIVAIVPKYTETGDITEIYTLDRTTWKYEKSLRSFIRKLFYFYTVDYIALKNKFRKLGVYQNVPIILKKDVYMKAKVRKPIAKSDGAFGYVNIKYINRFIEREKYADIEMTNGMILETESSYATLSKNYMQAKSVDLKILEKAALEK